MLSVTCCVNDTLKTYIADDSTKLPLKRNDFVKQGQTQIQNYLKSKNLVIKPLTKNDLKKLAKNTYSNKLCGTDMGDQLAMAMDDIQDMVEEEPMLNPSNIYIDNLQHITYVIKPLKGPDIILGVVVSVINYTDISIASNYDNYDKVQKTPHMYILIGCNNQHAKYKQYTSGISYFLRAYLLLETMKEKDILQLWGIAAGGIGFGDEANTRWKALNEKRGCNIYQNSQLYYCNPADFLNIFFDRLMNKKNLLLYTTQFDL